MEPPGSFSTVGASPQWAPAFSCKKEPIRSEKAGIGDGVFGETFGLKATDFAAHSLRAGFLTSAARRLSVHANRLALRVFFKQRKDGPKRNHVTDVAP
jgi:hypothetical protein